MQQFEVVFDVSSIGYRSWHAALFPACIAFASVPFALVPRISVTNEQTANTHLRRALAGAVAVVFSLSSIGLLLSTWSDFDGLRTAVKSGQCREVTGQVANFVPELENGHPREQFTVGPREFVYSSSDITSAFHWTYGQGGPVRAGQTVRICDVGGAIARLEIRR
jgi:hypothetical protein